MPSPKKITPTNPQVPIDQATKVNYGAALGNQTESAVNQNTAIGSQTYSQDIDPITGQPKLKVNTAYTPEQQQLLDFLQQNQAGIGGTAQSAISSMFPQYGGDPNLVGQAGSLTNQALDLQLPEWERFDAPARDQERTWLINQGLTPPKAGDPSGNAYQQQMDLLTQQQGRTRGAWLAGFQPQAFNEAEQQYQLPLSNVATMLGLSQPANLNQSFVNTPQFSQNPADVMGAFSLSQDAQKFNAQQQNAYWNAILGGGTSAAGKILGMPTSGTVGSSLYNSAVGGMGATG